MKFSRQLTLAAWTMVLLPVGVLLSLPNEMHADALQDTRDRLGIEAQRIEKEFAEGRALAYKLARADSPKLTEAEDKLQSLLALLRADSSLKADRRETLIRTLKWDLDKVREIAEQRSRLSPRPVDSSILSRTIKDDVRKVDNDRTSTTTRSVTDTARSIIESRSRSIADARSDRARYNDRVSRVTRSVEQAAIPETRDMTFPKNWKELSMKRSPAAKLTEKEKAVMKALGTVIDVDFSKTKFEDIIDFMRTRLKVDIAVDQLALKEVGLTYDSEVSLRLKATTRSVLKRMLADLNLSYVLKDEGILITSRERANQLTVTKAYYLGDLVTVTNVGLPPVLTQLMALDTASRIIASITQGIDPQSWKVNNPDAVGAVVFDPVTMSLIVKQSAENHFLMGGYR